MLQHSAAAVAEELPTRGCSRALAAEGFAMPEHSCCSSCWSQGCHSYSGSQREHQGCPSCQSRWCQLGCLNFRDCWCLSYFQDRAIAIVVDHQLESQQGHSGFDWQPKSDSSYFEHQIVESCFEQRLPNYWYCQEHLQALGYWTHRAPTNYWQLNTNQSLVTIAPKPYPELAIMLDSANLKIAAKDSWEPVANLELRRCCCWCCQYMHWHYQICSDQYNSILACCSIFHVGHLSTLAQHHLWHFSFYFAWLVLGQSVSGQGYAFVVKPATASFACKQRAIWVCHLDQLWSV